MSNELFKYPNVVGFGRGTRGDKEVVTVLVSRKLPLAALASAETIPSLIYKDTHKDASYKDARGAAIFTNVLEVGYIRALGINRKARHRPAPGGVSIGHYKITAGTLGSVVKDAETGQRLILSNNHVLANSNDAQIGDPILQSGPADGGKSPDDLIASLLRFQPIDFGQQSPTCQIAGSVARVLNVGARSIGSAHRLEAIKVNPQAANLIDAAVALPNEDGDVLDRIEDIGIANGTTSVDLGDAITKSGRTTETTTDKVLVLDATVQVSYGPNGNATFEGQIIGGPMSAGGDSGSLGVVAGDEPLAFGLLFAGSEQVTIFNPIAEVLNFLNITF